MSPKASNNIILPGFAGTVQNLSNNATSYSFTPRELDWRKRPIGINYGYSVPGLNGLLDGNSAPQGAILFPSLTGSLAASLAIGGTHTTGQIVGFGKSITFTTNLTISCFPLNYQQPGPGGLPITEPTSARPGYVRRAITFLRRKD